MKGGSISGNKIKKGDGLYGAGAGVCLSKSNVTISGGSITNNVTVALVRGCASVSRTLLFRVAP